MRLSDSTASTGVNAGGELISAWSDGVKHSWASVFANVCSTSS